MVPLFTDIQDKRSKTLSGSSTDLSLKLVLNVTAALVNHLVDLQRNNNNNIYLTAIGLLPGGSGFIHVHIYEKGARNLKPGGLHEKHAVATWSLGNHLSICLLTQGNQEKPVSRCPVAGEYLMLSVLMNLTANSKLLHRFTKELHLLIISLECRSTLQLLSYIGFTLTHLAHL